MSERLLQLDDLVGERYRVRSFVGEGGMQQVFLCFDELFRREVAVKAPKNLSAEKRFRRSAIVSAKVNHANVAKTLDYVESGNSAFLVEELVVGCDLSIILRERVPLLDPHLSAHLFHHLARGLAASHRAGVVHRDMKPSNIMIGGGTRFSEIKITDFGIAKMAEQEIAEAVEGGDEKSLNASVTAMGALPYMAPEAIESLRTAGKASDVWSMAAIVFECVYGAKPFGAGFKAAKLILDGKPPPVPTFGRANYQFNPILRDLLEVLMDCFCSDPSLRPSADNVVARCESLCYSAGDYEGGVVTGLIHSGKAGFLRSDVGANVFFHQQSVYGAESLKLGERALFRTHPGQGAGRAFPVLKAKSDV